GGAAAELDRAEPGDVAQDPEFGVWSRPHAPRELMLGPRSPCLGVSEVRVGLRPVLDGLLRQEDRAVVSQCRSRHAPRALNVHTCLLTAGGRATFPSTRPGESHSTSVPEE